MAESNSSLRCVTRLREGNCRPDLDTVRASGVVPAFLGGVLRDWLLEQGAIVLPRDAEYLADACIGMLRHSPSLRQQCDDVHSIE